MALEVALPLAYAASMAGFFAWAGRRNGFWWVAVPILLGAGIGTILTTLWVHNSALFTPAAIITVFSPAVVAFVNRSTGYRWWPSLSVSRGLVVAWLVVGGLLLIASIGVLAGLAFFGHR